MKNAQWLKNAQLNIVDSCFQNAENATAIILQKEGGKIEKVSQKQLDQFVNKIANGLITIGIKRRRYNCY